MSANGRAISDPRRLSLLLALCCTAQFMVILDVAIVNVALPSIRSSLHFSVTGLQWVVNAYAITFAGFLLLGGRAADLLGQRRVFAFGLFLFAFASLAGGLAPNRATLDAARAIQGLGGAVIAPASLSIITTTFPEGAERNRAVAMWGAMAGAGGAAGSLLGGVITQALTWRWILLINIPVGIVAGLLAWAFVVDRPREGPRAGFDLAGALIVTLGLVALVFGIVSVSTHGWGSAQTYGPIAAGVLGLAVFVAIEARVAKAPLMPLRLFRSRTLSAANFAALMLGAANFGMWYVTSLYLQEVLHLSPLGAGLGFLPMALTIVACATMAGKLVGRVGSGPVLGFGLVFIAVGMVGFSRMHASGGYDADFLVPALICSIGIGFSFVPATISAIAGVAPHEAGLASGLLNTGRQMGGGIGLAVLASAAAARTTSLLNHHYVAPVVALTDGFDRAFLIGAGFALVGAIVAFRFLPYGPMGPGRATPPRPAVKPADQVA